MKKLLLILMLLFSWNSFAYEFGVEASTGNLTLDYNTKDSSTDFSGDTLFYGGSSYVIMPVFEDINFEGGVYYDPLLKYKVGSIFTYQKNFLQFSFGPVLTAFNSLSYVLKPGLHTGVRIELPGYLYASLRADSTIGATLLEDGDHLQSLSDIQIGYYVKNAICTLQLETKTFMMKESKGTKIDGRTRYLFVTDVHQKNTPYRVEITFGYQELRRTFDYTTTTKLALGSILLGLKVDFNLFNNWTIYSDLESAIYNFPLEAATSSVALTDYIFDLRLGFKVKID